MNHLRVLWAVLTHPLYVLRALQEMEYLEYLGRDMTYASPAEVSCWRKRRSAYVIRRVRELR